MSSAATLFGDLAGVFLAAGDLPRALPGVLCAGDDLRAPGIFNLKFRCVFIPLAFPESQELCGKSQGRERGMEQKKLQGS